MIGILDSGVGGLSIYRTIKDRLPGAQVVYLADKLNFPYGEKSDTALANIVSGAVSKLIENGANIIVLACNSATVATIEKLRREYEVPIIGIEPAIKQAAQDTKTGNIGVMATERTIADHDGDKFSLDCNLTKCHNGELVSKIENNFSDITDSDLISAMEPFISKNVDSLVLGCTHYHFVKKRLEQLFPEIRFYAPDEAVVTRLLAVMNEKSIGLETGDDIFLVTADSDSFRKSLNNLLEITDAEIREI